MSAQFVSKIICFASAAALLISEPLEAQSASYSSPEPESSAIDAKGIRHRPSDYGDKRAPWMVDRIKFVQPNYPVHARARHKQGTGVFRISLDVNTGSVTKVLVVKSTGFSVLDDSAIKAIRLWRWRPGKWKEVETSVAFTLGSGRHPAGSAEDLTSRGKAYYLKGDNASAIKAFDEAIRLRPAFVEPYIMRASTYQAVGQHDKALADFDEAIRLDPKSARAYCDRAILKDVLSEPDRALADYNQAIHLAPNFQRAYFNRGAHFRDRHNYERAIADFSHAIQLMRNDFNTYGQRAYTYARQGDQARALTDANVAITLKPDTRFYLWRATDLRLRAEAYRILGRAELAMRDLRESVHVAPNDPGAYYELAWFLATCPEDRFRNGTDAVSFARKGCEISKWNNSAIIDALAAGYAQAGDFDQAIKYQKQALNDSSLAPKERDEREKRLALFQQRKAFRDEF
jgi:TonB family protein